jgi:hypothetical protein
MPKNWKIDLIIVLFLLVLCLLFFWRVITPNLADRGAFPHGDFDLQFYAFAAYEVRELTAGRVPLWNPYTFSGSPFLADIQSAIFYPPSLATILLSAPWGYSVFALELEAIAHFFLAGVFMYLFARRLAFRYAPPGQGRAWRQRCAALLAAITFTYGGYLTSYPSQQLAVLEVVTWLPLVLFFLDVGSERLAGEPRRRLPNAYFTLAGVALGLALLAGHPQTAMFVTYLATAYLFWRGLNDLSSRSFRDFRGLLAHWLWWLLVGFGLAAVHLVPGLEYMRLSVRAAGIYEKMAGGFPVYDVIQLLLPGSVSVMSPLYVGVVPLTLAVFALLVRRTREVVFWGIVGGLALLLSFGGNTFFYSILYLGLPGFGVFRGQERAAMIVSFSLAVLAGYGLLALGGAMPREARRSYDSFLRVVDWLLLVGLGLVVLFFYGLNQTGWLPDNPFYALLGKIIFLALLLGLAWLAYRLRGWGVLRRGGLLAAILTITLFDLFSVNWLNNFQPAPPEKLSEPPPEVLAIKQDGGDGVFRVHNEYRLDGNYGDPFAIEDTWGASPERLSSYDEFLARLPMERAWQLLNVQYVLTWRKTLAVPSQVIYQRPITEDDITYVHRLEEVSPRAWIVQRAELIADGDEALTRLGAPDFDPARAAVLQRDIGLGPAQEAAEPSQVQIVSRNPSYLELKVEAAADGLLVVSEIFYPGWRARVDGQEAEIYPVDYVLRGVKVGAGAHKVEMIYDPWTWKAGVAISIVALLLVVAIINYQLAISKTGSVPLQC